MNTDLASKKCISCEGGTPPLKPEAIQPLLDQLDPKWEVVDNTKLKKTFDFENFVQSMEFVNQVAKVAEEQQHHPNISIFYNRVKLELWTHAIGGLSENDFIMAAKINQIS